MKSQKIISLNPSLHYEVIGEINSSTNHEIDEKVAHARKAQLQWSNFSIKERIVFLEKLYHMLSKKGNPRWHNFRSIIDAMGLQFKLETKHKSH